MGVHDDAPQPVQEAVARAIWETWRKSTTADDGSRAVSWEDLTLLAAEHPTHAVATLHVLAFAEARAAIRAYRAAMKEAAP